MFYPKSPLSKGTSTESAIKGRGRIREFLELEADEETLKFCQKKELFVPTTEHELKVVLQTTSPRPQFQRDKLPPQSS
jgi:hypothetical protein